MTTSDQINELAAALAKAQGEIENARKDSANPFFKSSYADYASVRDAVQGPLSRNGIAFVQVPSTDGARVSVETRLMHASGQWISGTVSATAKDDGPQAIGSCQTYLRRYSLQAFTGVGSEDDDGNAAEARGKPAKVEQPKFAPKGFSEWEHDLAAAAAEGTEKLRETWKASKPEYRTYLTETNKDGLERLKALAAKVPTEAVSA
jgi:hypothetical protein